MFNKIKKIKQKLAAFLVMLLVAGVVAGLSGCQDHVSNAGSAASARGTTEAVRNIEETTGAPEVTQAAETEKAAEIQKDGAYTEKDEVALYLHTYGELPNNYITKKEAEKLGWDSKKGNLWKVAPNKSIGGSPFGNYEKQLPEKKGRKYYECDIDYDGKYRNAKRIIYSNDGLIFYTEDHYKSFEQLY